MHTSAKRPIVLIVEDEPLQRMMLVDLAEEAGFDTIEALDAEDAVSILEQRLDVWLVFADIDMPGGVDGLQLAAQIRNRWPPIELVIISGKRRLEAIDIPARAVFFSKPYVRQYLMEALQKMAM